jgi:hypothetical protein
MTLPKAALRTNRADGVKPERLLPFLAVSCGKCEKRGKAPSLHVFKFLD